MQKSMLMVDSSDSALLLSALQAERAKRRGRWPKAQIDALAQSLNRIIIARGITDESEAGKDTIIWFLRSAPCVSTEYAKRRPRNASDDWYAPEFLDYVKSIEGDLAWISFFSAWRQKYAQLKITIDHLKHQMRDMTLNVSDRAKAQSRRQRAAAAAENMMHILAIVKKDYRRKKDQAVAA